MKAAQERRREKSIRRREKVACADQRVYDLPETWKCWVRESKPKKNKKWVSGNVRKLVVQARLRMGMIKRIDKEKAKAKRALAVLEKALLLRNFAAEGHPEGCPCSEDGKREATREEYKALRESCLC